MIPICLFEDRQGCFLGVQLLVLSAEVHEPDWRFHAFVRNMDRASLDWLSARPNVVLRDKVPTQKTGWSVKPALLRLLLSENSGTVMWCDSDIILASPVSPIIGDLDPSVFVATEEYIWSRTKGSGLRAAGWGMKEVRPLSCTVNSCLMKLSAVHSPLLDAWDNCMSKPEYLAAQAASHVERPLHMMSDQDVLTALLSSEEHAAVDLFLLKNGRDIAQCFQEDGYAVHHRLRNTILRRTPPLVHAQGGKPWKARPRSISEQLSPYAQIARPYLVQESLRTDWLPADDRNARWMDTLFFRDPNLRGLIPAGRRTWQRVWEHRPAFLR
jgi:hypothetical protein